MNFRSVLQYAVNVLRVPHIIVCGHYDCGGVKAAMGKVNHDSRDLGSPLEDWLQNIRDVCRLHKDELDAITDPEAKHKRLVELNVIEQCLNIYKTGVVQRRRLLSSQVTGAYPQPRVHGVVYSIRDGRLKKLDHDFHKQRKKLSQCMHSAIVSPSPLASLQAHCLPARRMSRCVRFAPSVCGRLRPVRVETR